jgi:hypothetical protein
VRHHRVLVAVNDQSGGRVGGEEGQSRRDWQAARSR